MSCSVLPLHISSLVITRMSPRSYLVRYWFEVYGLSPATGQLLFVALHSGLSFSVRYQVDPPTAFWHSKTCAPTHHIAEGFFLPPFFPLIGRPPGNPIPLVLPSAFLCVRPNQQVW